MIVKINSQKEAYATTQEHFTYRPVLTVRRKGNSKNKKRYIKQPAFIDTETSWNHDEENPIGWIYQYCIEFNNQIVIGQDPFKLCEHLTELHDMYNLKRGENTLVIYCHNFSYDYSYIWQYLTGFFGAPEILALKAHKVLTADFDGLEFRCSYLLSNMSLAQWGKKLNCTIRKMTGAIDYDLIHYQDEELSQTDWEYMINDVLSMKECVYREMKSNEDDIASIVLTSTGYVRRDCRRAIQGDKQYRKWFRDTKLELKFYKLSRLTFAGGLTHGNRAYGGKTIYNVDHIDYKSHYPSCQQLEYMPMGKWLHYYNYQIDGSIADSLFIELLNTQCCIFTVALKNLRLKKGVTCPCVSKHKIHNYWELDFRNDFDKVGTDNGKVINCYGDIIISCTELDWFWILDQYETDGFFVMDLWTSERGRMDQKILDVINNYFIIKETHEPGVFRDKSKNRLNAIYGMTATDICRVIIEQDFNNLEWREEKNLSDEYIAECLAKYYKSRNSFNNYTHGIYTTSWARYKLLYIIKNIVGYDKYLYCDTDSVFYRSDPEVNERLEEYNKEQIERNKALGLGVVNRKGEMSYYGTLEHEDHCKAFRFLHSKCYAIVDDNDNLSVTIAGVTKDNRQPKDHPDYITSAQELGDIINLNDGFKFEKCGGTKSKYVNYPISVYEHNGHTITYASACIITETTKELGGTVEGLDFYEMV